MSEQADNAEKPKQDPAMTKAAGHEVRQLLKMCPPDQEPVLTILRSHLLAEHYLERTLAAVLPRGDRIIEAGSMSFAQKLAVVEALNVLTDQVIQALKGLNRVRNSCAHEMEREITIPDVERIGRPLGAEFTALRQKYYPDVKKLLHEVVSCIGRDLSGCVYFLERDAAKKFEDES